MNRKIKVLLSLVLMFTMAASSFDSFVTYAEEPEEETETIEETEKTEKETVGETSDEVMEPAETTETNETAEAAETETVQEEVKTADTAAEENQKPVLSAKKADDPTEDGGTRAESPAPYTPGQIELPFTKTWDDNDNAAGERPSQITVKLYRFKDGEQYDPEKPYKTEVLNARNNWSCTFVIPNTPEDPAFYQDSEGKWVPYKFAVVEETIPQYEEESHTDPSVKMNTINEDEDDWVWITPNSTLSYEVYTDTYPKNFIAAKKGNNLFIWTPEVISQIEQMIILQLVREHPQFPHEDWEGTTYLTGFGHHSSGFTMNAGAPGSIVFDDHPAWSFWARGTYTRSTPEENAGTIKNKYVPETVDISFTKVWEDADDQDGKRPTADEFAEKLTLSPEVEGAEPEVTDNGDNTYTVTYSDLPKYKNKEPVEYSVTEGTITGYTADKTSVKDKETITNTHEPEKTGIEITKVWEDADDQDGKRPTAAEFAEMLTLSPEVEGAKPEVTDNGDNTYTVTYSDLPKYKNKELVEYSVTEGTIDGYTPDKTTAKDKETITNTHEPEKTELKITKVWEDNSDEAGLRPDTVSFKITGSDGKEYTREFDGEGDQWTALVEAEKYYQGNEVTFTVDEDDVAGYEKEIDNDTLTIINTYTPPAPPVVEIDKVDDKGNPVKGAELGIYDESGNEIESWTTDGTTYVVNDLKAGKYTLKEINAPSGYEKAADIEFTVSDGETVTLKMVDKKTEQEKKKKKKNRTPDTGDTGSASLWLVMMIIMAALAGAAAYKRRMLEKEN